MPTTSTFAALYPYVRTLLGDTYSMPTYSNDQLDMGIRMGLLFEDPAFDETTVVASGDQIITPAVSNASDKLRISVRAALALLRPTSDEGGYRTPMLSVNSRGNISYQDLKTLLNELVNGGVNIVASDNEFDQAFNGITTVPSLLARFGITTGVLMNWGSKQTNFPNG